MGQRGMTLRVHRQRLTCMQQQLHSEPKRSLFRPSSIRAYNDSMRLWPSRAIVGLLQHLAAKLNLLRQCTGECLVLYGGYFGTRLEQIRVALVENVYYFTQLLDALLKGLLARFKGSYPGFRVSKPALQPDIAMSVCISPALKFKLFLCLKARMAEESRIVTVWRVGGDS
jgi:hypothetical protein